MTDSVTVLPTSPLPKCSVTQKPDLDQMSETRKEHNKRGFLERPSTILGGSTGHFTITLTTHTHTQSVGPAGL